MSKQHLPYASFLRRHSYVRRRQCNPARVTGEEFPGYYSRGICTACQPTYDFIRALRHSIMLGRAPIFIQSETRDYREETSDIITDRIRSVSTSSVLTMRDLWLIHVKIWLKCNLLSLGTKYQIMWELIYLLDLLKSNKLEKKNWSLTVLSQINLIYKNRSWRHAKTPSERLRVA